jgi:hypothetical protein
MLFTKDEMDDFRSTVHFKQNEEGRWMAFYLRPGTDDMPSFICFGDSKSDVKRKAMLIIHQVYRKAQEFEIRAKQELGLVDPSIPSTVSFEGSLDGVTFDG